jgi:hypothetical protein
MAMLVASINTYSGENLTGKIEYILTKRKQEGGGGDGQV